MVDATELLVRVTRKDDADVLLLGVALRVGVWARFEEKRTDAVLFPVLAELGRFGCMLASGFEVWYSVVLCCVFA